MKKILAALLVTAISVSSIGLTSSPAAAHDHGWSSEGNWRDGYDRDRGDGYYRDRGRNYSRDPDYTHGHSGKRHKNGDTAIIAGIAGLALGAVIVGSLANERQETPVYSRPANGDRQVYDPNY